MYSLVECQAAVEVGVIGPTAYRPVRAAMVMEYVLGHLTHYWNLRAAAASQPYVAPRWLPVPYEVKGVSRMIPLVRSNWAFRAAWRARRALQRSLAEQRPDVLFIHTQMAALFSLGIMRRTPSIVSVDATPINFDAVGYGYGHRAASDSSVDRFKHRLNRRAFHVATLVIAWSDWARKSLVEDYGVPGGKIRVLAPGAGPAYFELGQKRHAPTPAGSPRATPSLLFVGGDFTRKGGPAVLQALRPSLRAGTCELHLVTPDPVPQETNVYVHGGLTPNSPGLLKVFERADVFVLPTLGDCMPVVLMEATAAGLPVVTTRIGALPEIVANGESGFLVSPGDVESLRAALEALIGDPTLRSRMGSASLEVAERKFDARRNNRDIFALLHQVGSPARARPAAAGFV